MSVIIRLQNLPWSANSFDIRTFFNGLSIPEGGVHIVGGELGDAFIAFSTDEDARQAMMRSGGKIKEIQVMLMLSSRSEMQKVIEAARSTTFPTLTPVQPPVVVPTIPALPPQVPQANSIKKDDKPIEREQDNGRREPRRRSRSRSWDRNRSRSDRRGAPEPGRRFGGRRSPSRDRDRRRRRSRSRSRERHGRDRYGRDIEKRDEFKGERDGPTKKESHKERDERDKPAGQNGPPIDKLNFAGNQQPSKSQQVQPLASAIPDDPLGRAMKNTLSAFNLLPPEDKGIPGLGGDPRSGRDVSPGHGGQSLPDPGPAFGPNNFTLPFVDNQVGYNPMAMNMNMGMGMPFAMPGAYPMANAAMMQNPWFMGAGMRPLGPEGTINPVMGTAFPLPNDANRPVLDSNQDLKRDDDMRSRFGLDNGRNGGPTGRSSYDNPNRNIGQNDSTWSDRYPQNFEKRNDRFPEQSENNPVFTCSGREKRPGRDDDSRRSPNDRGDRRKGGDLKDSGRDRRDPRDTAGSGFCVELKNCPPVSYKDIRRAYVTFGCAVDDIKFFEDNGIMRIGVRFANWNSKLTAIKNANKFTIFKNNVIVSHLPDEEFASFVNNGRPTSEPFDRPQKYDRYSDRYRFVRKRDDEDEGELSKDANDEDTQVSKPEEKEPESTPIVSDVVLINGLPVGTTDRDLVDFFSDLGIAPKKLHLMLDGNGEPSGVAYVEFWQTSQALQACSKNGAPLGRGVVNVKVVPREDLLEALGEPDDNQQPDAYPAYPNMKGPPPVLPGKIPDLMKFNGAPPNQFQGPPPFDPRPQPQQRFSGSRFNRPENINRGPDPELVVTMSNVPYRAGTEEILEFFGHSYNIGPDEVFRKMNERNQPTSEARVVMPTPEDALRAVRDLHRKLIWDRPIALNILQHLIARDS